MQWLVSVLTEVQKIVLRKTNFIDRLVATFQPYPHLLQCIEYVLDRIPAEDAEEFFSDPNFRISLDDFQPGRGRMVHLPDPGPSGVSRCVVLKPRLESCSKDFVCYIVAHELAHAKLNNGGWGEITDREEAADAMAASWGFPRKPYE